MNTYRYFFAKNENFSKIMATILWDSAGILLID